MHNYAPRVVNTHNSRMGGYIAFILKTLAELLGDGRYMVLSLALPKSTADENYVISLFRKGTTHRAYTADGKSVRFRSDSISYAYRDDNKLMFVLISGTDGWLAAFRQSKIVVWGMGKVVKRLKAFNRPALLGGSFDSLNIKVVADDAYADRDLEAGIREIMAAMSDSQRSKVTVESLKERLLDGWIAISPRIMGELIRQSDFHPNWMRRKLQIKRVMSTQVFNIRVTTADGFIKGNAVVARNMPKGVDFMVAQSGIKAEIQSASPFYVVAEPQPPKKTVRTNVQTMINLPKLFRQSDLQVWLDDFFATARKNIREGKLLTSFSDVESMRWKAMKDSGEVEEGISAAMKFAGIEYVMRGGDIRKSPFMLKRMAESMVENLIDGRGNVRIPIPCAVYEQVISESAARMAGLQITVDRGTIRRLLTIGVHVVNDLDWIEMYDDMGGHDLDDFFNLFYRQVGDNKEVIVVRSPNEKGGYRRFSYVEGEAFPTWTKVDGTKVSFPKVNEKGWSKRISDALNDGSLEYTGLPSSRRVKSGEVVTAEYSVEDFLKDVHESLEGGSVGVYINARMLWDLTFPGMRRKHLCSLEDAIDTFVQAGAQEDRLAITEAAQELIDEVVASGRIIDSYVWEQRHASFWEGGPVNLGEGQIFKAHKLLKQYIEEFTGAGGWVDQFAQDNAAVPSPVVNVLGGQQSALTPTNRRTKMDWLLNGHYQDAIQLVKVVRRSTARAYDRAKAARDQALENHIFPLPEAVPSKEDWVEILKPIMDAIAARPEGVERHTFCMSLVAAFYSRPKRDGSVSDLQLWNNRSADDGTPTGPFPLIVEALRFFGILADDLEIDDEENVLNRVYINTWALTCVNCGAEHTTDNPKVYQRTMLLGGMCKNCRNAPVDA